MILPDVNLVLYAHIEDFPQHSTSKIWLEETLISGEIVGFAWQVLTAFVRIGTNSKVFNTPMKINQVEKIFNEFFKNPNVKLVVPTENHWQIFLKLLKDSNATGNLIMDAHLAALAIEHNAKLASTDKDFRLFPNLDYFNPLTEK